MAAEKRRAPWYRIEALWWTAIGYGGLIVALCWAWLPRLRCLPDPSLGSWADWFAAAGSIAAAAVAVGIALRGDRRSDEERRQRGDLVAIKLLSRIEGSSTRLDLAVIIAQSALQIQQAKIPNGAALRAALAEIRDAGEGTHGALTGLIEASTHISREVANGIAVAVEAVGGISRNAQAMLNNDLDPEQFDEVYSHALETFLPQLKQASRLLKATLPTVQEQAKSVLKET
jgi:hypothetical protein